MSPSAPIVFGSYCAGIEAASVASAPFGWRASYLCEIAEHPRAVLKHRHGARDARFARAAVADPTRPVGPALWGDFTTLRPRHLVRMGVELPEVICGGTPCQAFSRAGKRGSLDDARGNLTLEFVRQVHAIDNLRAARGLPGLAVLWENVPGVLNTADNAFGCFLGGLVGADVPVQGLPNGADQPAAASPQAGLFDDGGGWPEGRSGAGADTFDDLADAAPAAPDGGADRGPERFGKWPDAGMVAGPRGRAAWRVLDAQYFGLAQRRRRVFVVFGARNRLDPAAVLFEPQGLSRNPPARRSAGEGVAGILSARSEGGGGLGTDFELGGGLVADVAHTLQAGGHGTNPLDETLVAFYPTNRQPEFGVYEGVSPAVKVGSGGDSGGPPAIAYGTRSDASREGVALTPSADAAGKVRLRNPGMGVTEELSPTLDASGPHSVAFSIMPMNSGKDFKARPVEVAQALCAAGPTTGNQGGDFIVHPILEAGARTGVSTSDVRAGLGVGEDGDPMFTLQAGKQHAVAFALRGREGGALPEVSPDDCVNTLRAGDGGSSRDYVALAEGPPAAFDLAQITSAANRSTVDPNTPAPAPTMSANSAMHACQASAVRRLTPVECERLQGFPDGFTAVPWRGGIMPDGPRYKMLGNSWAVDCVRWIVGRLDAELRRPAHAS